MALSEDSALKSLVTGFSRVLQSGQYSDLTISSRHRKYAVHKIIVCSQSSFFRAACDGNFKESQSNAIDLLDDDPGAVDSMIRYFYTLTYPQQQEEGEEEEGERADQVVEGGRKSWSPKPTITPNSRLGRARNDTGQQARLNAAAVVNANAKSAASSNSSSGGGDDGDDDLTLRSLDRDLHVYVLGDKYGIPDLKKKAAAHFKKLFREAELISNVSKVIRGVYSMTMPEDRELRDIVTTRICDNIQYWVEDEEFMDMVRGEGCLGADLLSYYVAGTLGYKPHNGRKRGKSQNGRKGGTSVFQNIYGPR